MTVWSPTTAERIRQSPVQRAVLGDATDHDLPRDARGNVRFPGLNALRFFAACSVLISHVQEIIQIYGKPVAIPAALRYLPSGHQSVIFFFALSGYLITFLLLDEQRRTGAISVSGFYRRRVLRICPLYYVTVLIGIFVLPRVLDSTGVLSGFYKNTDVPKFFVLLMLLLPNIANRYGVWPAIAHIWSIGVEEQFYAVWPWLMRVFRRYVLVMLVGVVLLRIAAFSSVMTASIGGASALSDALSVFQEWLRSFQVECMAIGAIGAVWVFGKPRTLGVLFHPVAQVAVWMLTLCSVSIFKEQLSGMTPSTSVPLAVIFTLFILNTACNPANPVRLDNRILDELGKVSYGIYMYHAGAIFLVVEASLRVRGFPWRSPQLAFVCVAAAATLVTLSAAFVSYHLFEKQFLKLRGRT